MIQKLKLSSNQHKGRNLSGSTTYMANKKENEWIAQESMASSIIKTRRKDLITRKKNCNYVMMDVNWTYCSDHFATYTYITPLCCVIVV